MQASETQSLPLSCTASVDVILRAPKILELHVLKFNAFGDVANTRCEIKTSFISLAQSQNAFGDVANTRCEIKTSFISLAQSQNAFGDIANTRCEIKTSFISLAQSQHSHTLVRYVYREILHYVQYDRNTITLHF